MFILTALAKPLLKMGTIFIKAMLLHFKNNLLRPSTQKWLRLSWKFQGSFTYLFKKYLVLYFDFLSHTVKKLSAIL
jgi:hypothetical protein